jgi:integrase
LKFTNRGIQALKPKAERYTVWEDNGKGFGIRVSPAGRKSFLYLYRYQGKPRRMTLGAYPSIGLAAAHKLHAGAREKLDRGIDPGTEKIAKRIIAAYAPLFSDLVYEYIKVWAKPNKRSWREDKRILESYALPYWGNRNAGDIKRREIILRLDSIAETAPVQANRVLACLRKVFNFGIQRGIVDFNPCVLITPPGGKENPRDRTLDDEEVKKFWGNIDGAGMPPLTRLALKLLLVTAQRPVEIVKAERSEIDRDNKVWTIPPEKTKNGRVHLVPITDLALALLLEIDDYSIDHNYFFPSPKGKTKPIERRALAHAVRNNLDKFDVGKFTPHDLRRTATTQMTGLGITEFIAGKILNHTEKSVTGKHYDKYDYLKEKREALDKWSSKIESIISK